MHKFFIGLQYLLIFIISQFLLWRIVRRFYIKPINAINHKINNIPKDIIIKIKDKHHSIKRIHDIDTSAQHTSQIILCLIDELQDLHEKQESDKLKQTAQDIRTNMLNLMLIERHYSPLDKISSTKAAKIYSNLLIGMVNEKTTCMLLSEYLQESISYCQAYHHEFNISIKLDPIHDRTFYFKYTALTETIFDIFMFISRTANFDIEEIQVQVLFENGKHFPTFIIRTELSEQAQTALGWELGANFSCMSLFTIYLLARENNLFLIIDQQEQMMSFTLNQLNLLH